mgnify:CR=1 FL=1
MNSCDFSLENWACVEEKDATLSTFIMERTDRYITPLARDAERSAGGELSFLLSPWSPLAWMKDNDDMDHGGHLLPQYKTLWARYFVRFVMPGAKRLASHLAPLTQGKRRLRVFAARHAQSRHGF